MPEWWTYSLSDFLMFSPRTWHRLLELHNTAWAPLHVVTTAAAGGLLWAIRKATAGRLRAALVAAGLAWLFVASAFHWIRYAPINWAASWFSFAFGLQGLMLIWHGWTARDPERRADAAGRLGEGMVLAAMLYPLLTLASGRPLAQSEWVALMPDPTVLATLGMLLCLGRDRTQEPFWMRCGWLMPIPLLWCAITAATLWTLNAREWFLMPLAGMLALAMALRRKRSAGDPAAL